METTKTLRKQVKRHLINNDLDSHGWMKRAAKIVGCHYTQLSMAMTGYRQNRRSKEILERLLSHLKKNNSL